MGRRRDRLIWAVWFFVLLGVSAVFGLIGIRPNDLETGANVVNPGFQPSRALDDGYYVEVDSYATERLATRGIGIWARANVDYRLLGDSTNPEVLVGSDRWLFFAEYQTPDCAGLAGFSGLGQLGRGADQIRYAVTAPKAAFYSDRLDGSDQSGECVAAGRAAWRNHARDDPQAIPIDETLTEALAQQGNDGPDLFFPTDTHWSPEGRVLAAEAFVETLEPGLWEPDAVTEGELVRLQALSRFLGIQQSRTISGPTVERGGMIIQEQTTGEIGGEELVISQWSRSQAAETIPGVTYLIGDSQMAFLLPDIESYFEELVYINWLAVELGRTDFSDQPDPDRLIVQSIELDAPARFEHPVLTSLADRLPE